MYTKNTSLVMACALALVGCVSDADKDGPVTGTPAAATDAGANNVLDAARPAKDGLVTGTPAAATDAGSDAASANVLDAARPETDAAQKPQADAAAGNDAANADDSGGGEDSGAADASVGYEPALPPLKLGEALDTSNFADGQWTWIDFPETRCMDDSATGLGIKLNKNSDKLLIEIQGGNACFNQASCGIVWNTDGFGEAKLTDAVKLGILDSEDATNPFADWNMVFIPYCSGDIFSGMAMNGSGYEGRTQAGYHNIQEYLKRLVPTFAGSSHVVVSGFSAGGFGTTLNWVQVREAFGSDVRVDALNDSGPLMASDYFASCLAARLGKLWNWSDSIPASCTDCNLETGNVTEPLLTWLIEHTPEGIGRHGLISANDDRVIEMFYSFGVDDCAYVDSPFPPAYPWGLYADGLADFRTRMAGHEWAQMYELESFDHTWTTSHSLGDVVSNGVTLSDWLKDFLDRDSDWQTVLP